MRVIIAEDSVLLREGLVRLLHHAGVDVAAAVGDAQVLLAAVERERPDLVIVDVRMPPTHTDEGIRAALQLRQEHPGIAIIVLSQYVEERYAVDLLTGETRGVAYLLKDRVADVDEFLDTVQAVAAGGTVLDPEVVSQLLTRQAGRDGVEQLTIREREVLGLMAEGRSNAGIAAALHLSDSAVSKHINAIFTTLDIPPASTDNRRVLAVLRHLSAGAIRKDAR
ncbi:response regulator transcription factor [Nesterenkonia sp. HG001]|uniref:response regulator transcription factor n=1 Tax=Nesterenkonia sp. HG001 TaxID=2983207 RepID=UPI002AC6DBED|nr:response regulator transcription factor [Nesterenkonia sp. HG001]MDZ5077740.1 response regulator transcription factor [Nesterenkonia sp. HG001]